MADTLIHEIPTTATSFDDDDYIVLDGVTNGTRNMTQANLKNSVVAGNIAPLFDPTKTSSDAYAIGDDVIYEGEWYTFTASHYGVWNASHATRNGSYSDYMNHLASTSSFAATDMITVTNSDDGKTRKMSKDTLLQLTAQNALAGNVASAFDPTRDEDHKYFVGDSVVYEGNVYTFTADHYGAWNEADAKKRPIDEYLRVISKQTDCLVDFVSDLGNFTYVTGYFLNAIGTTFDTCKSASGGWGYYYKTVSAGERYRINSFCGQWAKLWYFFDSDGNKVGEYADSVDPNTQKERTADIVIPEGVATLAVNINLSRGSTGISIKKAEQSFEVYSLNGECAVIDSGKVKKSKIFDELGFEFDYTGDNLSFTLVSGYFLSTAGTTIDTCKTYGSSTWSYYYKSVMAGERYRINSYCGQAAKLWYFFDSDGNKVGEYADNVDPNTRKERTADIVIPEGVATLAVNSERGSYVPTNLPKLLIMKGYISYDHIKDVPDVVVPGDKMYGKSIVVCGDSITFGADMDASGKTDNPTIPVYLRSGNTFVEQSTNVNMTYGYQIAERHNMTYYNDGISGSTMQDISSKSGFSKADGRYTTLPDSIDYLVIFFGWNDTAYGSLGAITDNTNQSYYGGYNVVLPYLQNKYPYTKICLVVPFGTDSDHRNAIRLLANRWGVSVFDMYGAGTPLYYGKEDDVGVLPAVVTANRAKFQANGAHPNYLGHKQIADMLEQHLMGI